MSDFLDRLIGRTLAPIAEIRPLPGGIGLPPAATTEPLLAEPRRPAAAADALPRPPTLNSGLQPGPAAAVLPPPSVGETHTLAQTFDDPTLDASGRLAEPRHLPEIPDAASVHQTAPAPPVRSTAPGSHAEPRSQPSGQLAAISPLPATPNRPDEPSPVLLEDRAATHAPRPHSASSAGAEWPAATTSKKSDLGPGQHPPSLPRPSAAAPSLSVALEPGSAEAFRQRVRVARTAISEVAAAGQTVAPEPTLLPLERDDSKVGGPKPGSLSPLNLAYVERSAPAPSVQVTIGRVEVRAIMPPSPAPPRRPPPRPRLSLDEYLKQRTSSRR